jgi:AcrR family transcriptional regulator
MDDKGKQRPRAPHQLPPGRHPLGRSFVAANQRQRIFHAIVDITSLAGYATMSVEDIIGTAGISRRTFYDTFSGKDDAFLAALDGVVAELLERIRTACAASDSFADGVRDCLAAFLQFLTDEPQYADMLLIEALAAGPEAMERRNATIKTCAKMLRTGASQRHVTGRRPPDLTAETIVGGIYEVAYSRVIAGEAKQLLLIQADLAYSLMQPYIGHEAARLESAKPARQALVIDATRRETADGLA